LLCSIGNRTRSSDASQYPDKQCIVAVIPRSSFQEVAIGPHQVRHPLYVKEPPAGTRSRYLPCTQPELAVMVISEHMWLDCALNTIVAKEEYAPFGNRFLDDLPIALRLASSHIGERGDRVKVLPCCRSPGALRPELQEALLSFSSLLFCRFQSRSFSVSRLSCSFLPLARASSSFARPFSLK
jgi:hypothetical protein